MLSQSNRLEAGMKERVKAQVITGSPTGRSEDISSSSVEMGSNPSKPISQSRGDDRNG
jgi:hypothetical protein